MVGRREPRVGDIFWLSDCAPLHGDAAKTRPVIVLATRTDRPALHRTLVVACTSTAIASNTAAIEIPNHPSGRVRTGLQKRTWAVPQWHLFVDESRLVARCGYVSGKLLEEIANAVAAIIGRTEKN
jgi:mRNA-degrading endonuclease toxin of MazEF toxin-antitoxin module